MSDNSRSNVFCLLNCNVHVYRNYVYNATCTLHSRVHSYLIHIHTNSYVMRNSNKATKQNHIILMNILFS